MARAIERSVVSKCDVEKIVVNSATVARTAVI